VRFLKFGRSVNPVKLVVCKRRRSSELRLAYHQSSGLWQETDTHYERIEETMAPLALRAISEWIQSETKL
jgi:hypothetical protein